MAPKCRRSNGSNSDMPEGSHKVLLFSEKVYNVQGENIVHIGCRVSAISGIHWVSWNISPMDKGGLSYRALVDHIL